MFINLSSTSFLMNNNNNWSHLNNFKFLNFKKYGEIFDFKERKNVIDINIIFLSDIIDTYSQNISSLDYKKIDHILKKIEIKIRISQTPIIACISGHYYNNIIESSQIFSKNKKIKYYFLENLYKISKKENNLYIVDIDEFFSLHGINNCFDNRNFNLSRCRLSPFGIEVLAKNLKKIITRIYTPNKKVLLLDCDNTIWGGVIAEDGITKIKIGEEGEGRAFYEFQKAIKKLKDQGIIIILVSKNIKADVVNVLKNHQGMCLKEKDISAFKVNWNEKSQNIQEISKELSLNLDSFVFWDDNPVEREKVRIKLKNVEVIEPDNDISNWAKQLLENDLFSKFKITKSDQNKTQQYQIRQKFIDDKQSHKSELDYLRSIKIQLKLIKIEKGNINRAVQMCQKTNQFNLSTKRYDHNKLNVLNKKNICFMVHMKDVYGDHGIISLVCLKLKEKKFLLIDTFLMSCRVLGRYAENWILNEIIKVAKKKKINNIVAEFLKTEKNEIAGNFLKNNNFNKISKKNFIKNFKEIKLKNINKKTELFLYTGRNVKYLSLYEKK